MKALLLASSLLTSAIGVATCNNASDRVQTDSGPRATEVHDASAPTTAPSASAATRATELAKELETVASTFASEGDAGPSCATIKAFDATDGQRMRKAVATLSTKEAARAIEDAPELKARVQRTLDAIATGTMRCARDR